MSNKNLTFTEQELQEKYDFPISFPIPRHNRSRESFGEIEAEE